MIRKEAGEEEGILKNKSKNFEKKTSPKDLLEMEPIHKPLQLLKAIPCQMGQNIPKKKS